jgi:hypothetical protein
MATWLALRNRLVMALGEFDSTTVAADGSATFDDVTVIYPRLAEKYRFLYRKALKNKPDRFVATQTFDYTANAESVNIDTLPTTSMRWRQLVRLENYENTTYPRIIRKLTEAQWRAFIADGSTAAPGTAGRWDAAYYLAGGLLYLAPKPAAALTLRAHYLPIVDTIDTGDPGNDSPLLFPEEHHEVIALEAAISLSLSPSQGLLMEHARMYEEFMAWTTERDEVGTRYVHDVYGG